MSPAAVRALRSLCLWVCWLWLCVAGVGSAGAQEVRFEHATIVATIDGVRSHDVVTLPFRWDLQYPGQSGTATLELEFMQAQLGPAPWGLYMPKIGSAYVVSLNGEIVQRDGDLDRFGTEDTGKGPRLLPIPTALVKPHNVLHIQLRADSGRKPGLSAAILGGWSEVQAEYWSYWRFRTLGLIAVVMFSLLIGTLCFSLWLTQPGYQGGLDERRDPLYLFSALAELCWALRVADALIETPPLPWPLWGVVPILALGAWGCLTSLFCMEVVRWRNARWAPGLRRWMACLMGAGLVMVPWGLVGGLPVLVTIWYGLLGLTFLMFSMVFTRRSFGQGGTVAGRLLAGAVLLNAATGLGDLVRLRTSAGSGDVSSLYYSSVLFGLVMGYVVISRFRSVTARARELLQTLEQRVQDKEAALRESYAKLEAQTREQARVAERTRILRDMHDGVGSHISVAIRQLQNGIAPREEVLQTLQESMDQLKLSIDSMHLPPGDINAVLANVRYRMEPRLLSSGIQLAWDVDVLAPVVRWDEKATRQLQFMVYETISNVLQHARASEIRITAREVGEAAVMTLADNGRGFEVETDGPRSLLAMRQRAHALGVQLEVRSRPGETVVEITVPWG